MSVSDEWNGDPVHEDGSRLLTVVRRVVYTSVPNVGKVLSIARPTDVPLLHCIAKQSVNIVPILMNDDARRTEVDYSRLVDGREGESSGVVADIAEHTIDGTISVRGPEG